MNAPDRLRADIRDSERDSKLRIESRMHAFASSHSEGYRAGLDALRHIIKELEAEIDYQDEMNPPEPDDRFLDDPRRGLARELNRKGAL